MLSFTALFLLVAIGAVGVYLALPRGPESEHRSIRLIGLGLGIVSVIFLAVATEGRLPEDGSSGLASIPSALTFYTLAMTNVIAGGMAVAGRTRPWLVAATALMLLTTAGLLALLGSPGAAWLAAGLAVATGAGAAVMFHRDRPLATVFGAPSAESAPHFVGRIGNPSYGEVCREPLLACVAGGFLAAGLVTAVHAALAVELPRTMAIETNRQPSSQRHRAFPRRRALLRVVGNAAPDSRTSADAAATFRASDLPLAHHALALAMLLAALGTIGVLSRRSPVAVAASWAVMLQAVAIAAGAFATLHGGAGRPGLAWLPLAVMPIEGGLLAAGTFVRHGRDRFEAGE